MRTLDTPLFAALALSMAPAVLIVGCSSFETSSQYTHAAARGEALILQESDGERRLHRPPPGALSNLTAPFILKVDRSNGGAPEFVMHTEDIPPGQAISPHRHPHSDEIIWALDRNTFEDRMTILDPGALAHPWVMTLIYHHVANMPHIVDRDCAENDRNPIVDGKISIAPPKP